MPERSLNPRRALFGNPERSALRVSPDGRHLAFVEEDWQEDLVMGLLDREFLRTDWQVQHQTT